MSRNSKERDDRLRGLLRRGDPAAADGLTRDEIHAMRRAVLNAAPDSRRRSLLIPAFVATCAVLLTLSWWWLRSREPQVEPPREASVAPAAVAPVLPPPVPDEEIAEERSTRPIAPHPPVVARDEPHSRQIQFSTPGGTRVVWVLTTEDVL
jgi:hypothetical protein